MGPQISREDIGRKKTKEAEDKHWIWRASFGTGRLVAGHDTVKLLGAKDVVVELVPLLSAQSLNPSKAS